MTSALLWLTLSIAASSTDDSVRIKSADGFELAATYYAAPSPGPAVLLLPQCNMDRTAYASLGAELAAIGLHALALDLRGFGESVGGPVGSFIAQKDEHLARYPADIDAAAAWLRERSGSGKLLGVVGASCGATPALQMLYRPNPPIAAVFISTTLPWLEKDAESKLSFTRVPVLCVVARDDAAFRTTNFLFNSASHPRSRLVVFKGDTHGLPLQETERDFTAMIARWLKTQLRVE